MIIVDTRKPCALHGLHGECLVCKIKADGNLFERVNQITRDSDQTQTILNTVFAELIRHNA